MGRRLSLIFLLPLKFLMYGISCIVPRNKACWAFGSRNGQFVDNPKYFFLHVLEHQPDIRARWISSDHKVVDELNNQGFPALYKWSIAGVWFSLRAGSFIYAFDSDDVNFFLSGGAKTINLYHGIPLKKIEFDTVVGPSAKVYHPTTWKQRLRSKLIFTTKWQKISLFQVPSKRIEEISVGAFGGTIQQFNHGLNPRLQPLVDVKESLPMVIREDMAKTQEIVEGFNRVWLYMPTWRTTGGDILNTAFEDLPRVNEILKENNDVLFLKMHLYSNDSLQELSNIKLFPGSIDVYPFLHAVDVLITDYSSIAFDFAIAQKNIVFYAYDREEYTTHSSSGFYFDYDEVVNHRSVSNFDQLLELFSVGYDLSGFQLSQTTHDEIWPQTNSKASPQSVHESNARLVAQIGSC